MATVMNVVKFAINTIKVSRKKADPITDYDQASKTYDEFYSRHLGKKSLEFLDHLPISPRDRILDLPCGTGFLTAHLARRAGPEGRVQAVDLSEGMLERCRANTQAAGTAGLAKVEYVQADALRHVQSLASESLDLIVCAWGICYLDWPAFLKECHRCLKMGGVMAIIENRKDSLSEISKLYAGVLLDFPDAMAKTLKIDLPRGSDSLAGALRRSGFALTKEWNGEVSIPVADGSEAIEYLRKAGVSSGFLDAIRKDRFVELEKAVSAKLDAMAAKNRAVPLIHRFAAVIGEKRVAR